MLESLECRRLLSGTVVTIITPDHTVTEGEIISFEVQRTGDLSDALTLDVTLSGTATPGVDTMIPDGSLTFAPGEDMATYSLAAVDDGDAEIVENLVARVDTTVETNVLIDRGDIDVTVDDAVFADLPDSPDSPLVDPYETLGDGPDDTIGEDGIDLGPNAAARDRWRPHAWTEFRGDPGLLENLGNGQHRLNLPYGWKLWFLDGNSLGHLNIPRGSDIEVVVFVDLDGTVKAHVTSVWTMPGFPVSEHFIDI